MNIFQPLNKIARIALLLGVVCLLAASLAFAGGETGQWRSLLAGGGSQVSSGALRLSSALGQPVAGMVGGEGMIGASGFWVGAGVEVQPPPGAEVRLFVPLIFR